MRFLTVTALSLLVASSSVIVGCGSTNDSGLEAPAEEQDLVKTKSIATKITSPSGLIAAGGYVYFGSNSFVASGDPELDQQFAYWQGKFSRVPVAGGKREVVSEVGPITQVRTSSSKLLYAMADACWIASMDASGAASSNEHVWEAKEGTCGGEEMAGIAGFDVADGKFVVVDRIGDVNVGKLDGSSMKKVGAVSIGDWGDVVQSFAVADGNVFILTQTNLGNNPQALYKVPLAGGSATKVLEFTARPQTIISDGQNIYVVENEKVSIVAAGSSEMKEVASGFGAITEAVVSGGHLYVADAKRDAIYQVRDAAGAASKKRKLATVKDIATISVDGSSLYFGSGHIDSRKPGVIGVLSIPE